MIRSRLAVIMAERDIRQDEMAATIGISKATLSNIANNRTAGLQYSTLEKIAIYLDVSIEELFDFAPYIFEFSLKDGTKKIESETSALAGDNLYHFTNEFGETTQGTKFPETCFYNGELTIISTGMTNTTVPLSVSIFSDDGIFPERQFDPVGYNVPVKDNKFDFVAKVGMNYLIMEYKRDKLPFAFQKQFDEQVSEFIKDFYSDEFKKNKFFGKIMLQIFSEKNQIIIDVN